MDGRTFRGWERAQLLQLGFVCLVLGKAGDGVDGLVQVGAADERTESSDGGAVEAGRMVVHGWHVAYHVSEPEVGVRSHEPVGRRGSHAVVGLLKRLDGQVCVEFADLVGVVVVGRGAAVRRLG